MERLLDSIRSLSGNRDLFQKIQEGERSAWEGDIAAIPAGSYRNEALTSIRAAIVALIKNDEKQPLKELISESGLSWDDKVLLLGEFVLALIAVATCSARDEGHGATHEQIEEIVLNILNKLGKGEKLNEARIIHHRAYREWLSVIIWYFKSEYATAIDVNKKNMTDLNLNQLRSTVTCIFFNSRPGLVGNSFVLLAKSAEASGDAEFAKRCFRGVYGDLNYVDKYDNMPRNLRFELFSIMFWFEECCLGLLRHDPEDSNAAASLERVQKLRKDKDLPDPSLLPHFGPIARTYLDRTPYLASVLEELQNVPDGPDKSLFPMAERYDYCHELDLYQSAMGSYYSARPLLQSMGVTVTYDDSHMEVFDALDYITTQREANQEAKSND